MENLIEKMKSNAKAVNKFLTREFLDNISYVELLNRTHPEERDEFKRQLKKQGLI